ncbi:helix-turn-helix domain-containing protein [Nocardioides limicola]|uniref:helix-turn-helix domain-containing protein n=1 Tax=Nocardioides limicola TaxID=2803368 RepID=UPI00193B55F6|nr:helix-turn-helix domain-containing protein [Nocardioides sp. DJM-14]
MRDLIGKLEVVDDDTASALRVIDHFDHLLEERASKAAVVRAVAVMAGCPAGLHDAAHALTRRFAPSGRALPIAPTDTWRHEPIPGHPGSWLWLERTGPDGPLDALIVERAARALQALAGDTADRSTMGMVRIACDLNASDDDRRDAVMRLGLLGPVTVVVSRSMDLQASLRTAFGSDRVALLPGTPTVPEGIRAGVSVAPEPLELPTALEQARVALRVADEVDGSAPSLVTYEGLGALACVVERFTPEEAAMVEDVRRIDNLLAGHPWVIQTLQAVLDQTSLRQSATMLHLHHSTLQERLTWLSAELGYSPLKARGRTRAGVAVLLWRIAHCREEPPQPQ